MPRWTSLVALAVLALVGGAVGTWAEAPLAVGAHETAPASEADPLDAEEEATRPARPVGASAALPAPLAPALAAAEWPRPAPPPRPPR